jgi:hypothetical protein
MTMAGKRKQHPATSDSEQAGAATRKLEKKLDAARATESKRLRRLAKAQTTQARIVAKRQQEAADAAAEVSRLASKLAAANRAAIEAAPAAAGDTPGDGGEGGEGGGGAAVDVAVDGSATLTAVPPIATATRSRGSVARVTKPRTATTSRTATRPATKRPATKRAASKRPAATRTAITPSATARKRMPAGPTGSAAVTRRASTSVSSRGTSVAAGANGATPPSATRPSSKSKPKLKPMVPDDASSTTNGTTHKAAGTAGTPG